MKKQPIIVVQGSLNYDFVVKGGRLPLVGETVIGSGSGTYSGGKGANQAVQLAKLGAEVYMVGRVGSDDMGRFLLATLQGYGVHTDYVIRDDGATGTACVQCDERGDQYIMVAPNANGRCKAEDVRAAVAVLDRADAVMCQLETTDEAMLSAAHEARARGIPLILNPAPAHAVTKEVFALAHTVTPNETEAAFYAGMRPEELAAPEGRAEAAARLRALGAGRVVITLGALGSYYDDGSERAFMPPFSIKPVDTTAAGDAFNGAYTYAVACGLPLAECLRRANAAGALAATRLGAQPSMCDAEELEQFLLGV